MTFTAHLPSRRTIYRRRIAGRREADYNFCEVVCGRATMPVVQGKPPASHRVNDTFPIG